MKIKWSLRLVIGTVVREKDQVSVNTTLYGSTDQDTAISTATTHGKAIWIQTDGGEVVTAHLKHTENISASPGDRVRVVFADPGAHVVGLANETLKTSWKWKYPSEAGFLALLLPLAFFGLLLGGLIAFWQGNLLVGIVSLAIVGYIVAVPLGNNRRKIRELHSQRDEMLSARQI